MSCPMRSCPKMDNCPVFKTMNYIKHEKTMTSNLIDGIIVSEENEFFLDEKGNKEQKNTKILGDKKILEIIRTDKDGKLSTSILYENCNETSFNEQWKLIN